MIAHACDTRRGADPLGVQDQGRMNLFLLCVPAVDSRCQRQEAVTESMMFNGDRIGLSEYGAFSSRDICD